MSWDEAFASEYAAWSADVTADIGFYMPSLPHSQEYVFVARTSG
jgi:hypothetical protein